MVEVTTSGLSFSSLFLADLRITRLRGQPTNGGMEGTLEIPADTPTVDVMQEDETMSLNVLKS